MDASDPPCVCSPTGFSDSDTLPRLPLQQSPFPCWTSATIMHGLGITSSFKSDPHVCAEVIAGSPKAVLHVWSPLPSVSHEQVFPSPGQWEVCLVTKPSGFLPL